MKLLIAATIFAASLVADDEARLERTGNHVMVTADCPRPLHAVAAVLFEHFGLAISVEDPQWTYAGDLRDASLSNSRMRPGVLVPRGGRLEVEFKMEDAARDASAAMMALLEAANQQLTLRYRLDKDGDRFRLVPVRARNAQGELADIVPLLDRPVTIPHGPQTLAEVAQRMAEDLSKQTGLRVSCCQSAVAGIPWGMERITYGADHIRARDLLKFLTGQPRGPVRWMSRCDRQFCMIDFR